MGQQVNPPTCCSNNQSVCARVYVCVCVHVHARACVCSYGCVCVCVCAFVCVHTVRPVLLTLLGLERRATTHCLSVCLSAGQHDVTQVNMMMMMLPPHPEANAFTIKVELQHSDPT